MAADTRDDFKAVFETCLQSILPRFGLTELRNEQKKALFYLFYGKDDFVNLPTGFGKSLNCRLWLRKGCREGLIRMAIFEVASCW